MPVNSIKLELGIEWESIDANHKDYYIFPDLGGVHANLPATLRNGVNDLGTGEILSHSYAAGELVVPYDKTRLRTIPKNQFRTRLANGVTIALHPGRFYPRTLIAAAIDASQPDTRPFRLLRVARDTLQIDLNHPLAHYPLDVSLTVSQDLPGYANRHGVWSPKDPIGTLCDSGPGLQARAAGMATEFITADAFDRADNHNDTAFYQQPRLVAHLDKVALQQFTSFYTRFVNPGMHLLDLMSSWKSHLPENITDLRVTGLGMNREELRKNPQLSNSVVFDLNRSEQLPYAAEQFDLAICTVSVEYLINPINVFKQVARVLKPGAPFVVTFSERWFPPKVIQLWTQLHPFERLGLVLDYFRQSQAFSGLHTETVRGLPRPRDDKYAGVLRYSDPLYAAWGYANA
jgi:SAM-dependent methyltransferase